MLELLVISHTCKLGPTTSIPESTLECLFWQFNSARGFSSNVTTKADTGPVDSAGGLEDL